MDGALTTFGCVKWESDMFRGVMRARCYLFDMPKKRFHSFNLKVCCNFINFMKILVHAGTYSVLVHAQYVPVCTGTYYDLYCFAVLGQDTILIVPAYL